MDTFVVELCCQFLLLVNHEDYDGPCLDRIHKPLIKRLKAPSRTKDIFIHCPIDGLLVHVLSYSWINTVVINVNCSSQNPTNGGGVQEYSVEDVGSSISTKRSAQAMIINAFERVIYWLQRMPIR